MVNFFNRPKDNSDLVDDMARALAHVEGQLAVYHAALTCIISRLGKAERDALSDAIWEEAVGDGGWPAWLSEAGRTTYFDTRRAVHSSITGEKSE
jgi:hypothetical protein